ncbi:MAG: septum site-determining protein MinC [Rhizobiaceae bacterium]|nr:septum site-determining protein MinC [Rhizobiaceae bacterium]MCV0408728.1 septum site-determining protein MinC [Rhizobiaceae bacterium]
MRFPARSFLAFALTPEAPLDEWLESLDAWTCNSPGFFTGRPVVLDLNLLRPTAELAERLVGALAARDIRIYAIEANGVDGFGPDMPPLLKGARPATIEALPDEGDDEPVAPATAAEDRTLIVDQPVRSGQSIYHAEGDVVVLGSVASGAEVLAAGSIHIYGALRGRAFAGVTGNDKARIFCRKNEAEMLAIDGWYRTAEDMESSTWGKPVQARLENGVVFVAAHN